MEDDVGKVLDYENASPTFTNGAIIHRFSKILDMRIIIYPRLENTGVRRTTQEGTQRL